MQRKNLSFETYWNPLWVRIEDSKSRNLWLFINNTIFGKAEYSRGSLKIREVIELFVEPFSVFLRKLVNRLVKNNIYYNGGIKGVLRGMKFGSEKIGNLSLHNEAKWLKNFKTSI